MAQQPNSVPAAIETLYAICGWSDLFLLHDQHKGRDQHKGGDQHRGGSRSGRVADDEFGRQHHGVLDPLSREQA